MLALFTFRRKNIFSYSDVALKNGIMKAKGYKTLSLKKIRESENKDWKESTYLAITLLYDDLVSNGNKKGLENLMVVVKNIYPDLTDDIITYGT